MNDKVQKMLRHCKLCKQQKKLIRAHLLPDGFKKFALSENDSSLVLINRNTGWHKSKQTLEYDPEILCKECDGLIGKSEDALQNFIRDFIAHPSRNTHGNQKITVSCQSDRIILAILAILLKYSFSRRYPDLTLGEKYERIISEAISSDAVPREYGKQLQIVVMGSNSYLVSKNGKEMDLSRIARAQLLGGRTGNHHTYFIEPPGTFIAIKVGQAPWNQLASNEAVQQGSGHVEVHTAPFEESILHEDMLSGVSKRFEWIENRRKERADRHRKK